MRFAVSSRSNQVSSYRRMLPCMAKPMLPLGTHSEPTFKHQRRDSDGVWRNLPGSERYRKGDRTRARCYVRGHDGVMVERSALGDSRAKAEARLLAAVDAYLSTCPDVTLKPSTKLSQAGEAWLESLARSDSGRSESTRRVYRLAWTSHIMAEGSPLRELTLEQANNPQRLAAFLRAVADKPSGGGTGAAKQCKAVLSGVFTTAVRGGALQTNATRDVGRITRQVDPRQVAHASNTPRPRDHRRAFTREERDRIITILDAWAGEEVVTRRERAKRQTTAGLVAFLAGTGVRIAEARALTWEQVHLPGDDGEEDSRAYADIHGTKTRGSRRRVGLPAWLVERLQERRDRLGREGLVFPAPHAGDPHRQWDQANSAHAVRQALDLAGFPWAVSHTFRRSVATHLDAQGVPVARIADTLGHADPSMTMAVYLGRDFEGDKDDLAALL